MPFNSSCHNPTFLTERKIKIEAMLLLVLMYKQELKLEFIEFYLTELKWFQRLRAVFNINNYIYAYFL